MLEVMNMRLIDAEHARHAHWKVGDRAYNIILCKWINEWICSSCGKRSLEYGKYCPQCGAIMDEE